MAKIININSINSETLEILASELKNGKIFVLPTSTLYGICANAFNEDAVNKIYKIKKREYTKPLIVLVDGIEMLKKVVRNITKKHEEMINKFWPGSLTIIFKRSNFVPRIVTAQKESIAVRMDSSYIVNKLITMAKVPIVAPSANISGNLNISSIGDLEKQIVENVDYIIDGGVISSLEPSTIVKFEKNCVKIIREGKIKKKELENIFYDNV